MTIQLYIYLGSALAGLVFHWITTGKGEADRPSAIEWIRRHPMYPIASLGLTAASALFFMPSELGPNAYAAAVAMGMAGGSAIKNLFIAKS